MRRSMVAGRLAEAPSLRQGFPKTSRILKRPEFLKLGEEGQRLVGRHFVIVYAPGEHAKPRLGITVTKKIGPAVTRNRLKRVCREFFRTYQGRLAASYDIHVIARHAAVHAARDELLLSLEKLFSQIA